MADANVDVAPKRPLDVIPLRAYLAARLMTTIAIQCASLAIGWQVFAWTHDPLMLGMVGLAQFLPMTLFTPFAGEFADRTSRQFVAVFATGALAVSLCAMTASSQLGFRSLAGALGLASVFGVVRAFAAPALSALVAELVPSSLLPPTLALVTSMFQGALVIGPAIGGFVYASYGPTITYGVSATLLTAAAITMRTIERRPAPHDGTKRGERRDYLAGIRFVRSRPALLGAMSLDLAAVLLGGAVALLPAVTSDLLHAGPRELGWLRAAPAVGATLTGLVLARHPLRRRVGRWLLGSVAVFGAATVGFGLSRSFRLSLACLVVAGASDMVSMYVRQALVQLETPNAMRGRVSAVSQLFIGASNELGELESGITARWLGLTRAIVAGGVGTILVVGAWMKLFPALRDADEFAHAPDEPTA